MARRQIGLRTDVLRTLLATASLTCVCTVGINDAFARSTWNPSALSKRAVQKDLYRLAPTFRSFLMPGSCSGSSSNQFCIVTGSISNDDVRGRVRLRRKSGRVTYTDHVSLTAVMGGGTVKYTYSGAL